MRKPRAQFMTKQFAKKKWQTWNNDNHSNTCSILTWNSHIQNVLIDWLLIALRQIGIQRPYRDENVYNHFDITRGKGWWFWKSITWPGMNWKLLTVQKNEWKWILCNMRCSVFKDINVFNSENNFFRSKAAEKIKMNSNKRKNKWTILKKISCGKLGTYWLKWFARPNLLPIQLWNYCTCFCWCIIYSTNGDTFFVVFHTEGNLGRKRHARP